MAFRGGIQYLRALWQRSRGTIPVKTPRENLIQLRFELTTWVHMIVCLIYLIYLNLAIASLFSTPAYLNALAFPARNRGVLFIAVLLGLIAPVLYASAIELWLYRKKVLARTYLLLQVVFSGFLVAYLIWSDLVLAWVG